MWRFGTALAVSVLLLLVQCGGPSNLTTVEQDSCSAAQREAYANAIEPQLGSFQQQFEAGLTSPEQADQPLRDLQQATQTISPPECLAAYHARVIDTMELHRLVIQAVAVPADATRDTWQGANQVAIREMLAVQGDLALIRGGAIPLTPTPNGGLVPTTQAELRALIGTP